jgi:acetolactate synthase-1/2/3 large subunit
VEATADFAPAFEEAMRQEGVRLLHCKTDVEVISNATTITRLREKAKS